MLFGIRSACAWFDACFECWFSVDVVCFVCLCCLVSLIRLRRFAVYICMVMGFVCVGVLFVVCGIMLSVYWL